MLVHPVTQPGETQVKVYFPGQDTLWYEIESYEVCRGNGYQNIPVVMEKVKSALNFTGCNWNAISF